MSAKFFSLDVSKLPELLRTLDLIEKYGETTHVSAPYRDSNQALSPPAVSKGELRYEAYEAPQAPLKQIRPRDLSQGPSFESSTKSSPNTPRTLTLSPGQLALAVYEMDLTKIETKVSPSSLFLPLFKLKDSIRILNKPKRKKRYELKSSYKLIQMA